VAWGEELGELDFGGRAVGAEGVEDVVLGDEAAGRQVASGDGDRFHGAAESDLLLQQVQVRVGRERIMEGLSEGHQ
jgi:hypothetical protein